jgi:glycosyltransferase involved in cell wall biosynthesis
MILPQKSAVIFVANRGFALTSSRILLMQHFLSTGWQVVAATTKDDYAAQLSEVGVIVEPVPFNRGGLTPLSDLKALFALIRVYRQYRPRLIHHFHAKPIILGSLGTYFASGANIVNTVTGLGYAFVQGGITHHLAASGYRFLLAKSAATIFQNPDDRQFFVEQCWIPASKAHLIVSSGVDTERFRPAKATICGERQCVLMVARLLWQKGVREFVEAAEIVKRQNSTVRFQLAGEWDPDHPDAVDRAWVQSAVNQGTIEFLGYLENVAEQLRITDLFVLPSFYREGVPRVLLEAAACEVPVVTTDVPGCREAVVNGETGRLVPPRDSKSLARAISEIVSDSELRQRMGEAARRRVEVKFDIRVITQRQLAIYRDIGINI